MVVRSTTLYFGYGSNLWLEQMSLRCPASRYEGIARLPNYRWIINDRGYANVVSSSSETEFAAPITDVVYGVVFSLTQEDEDRLDINEGVPQAYTKEYLTVDFWPGDLRRKEGWVDITERPQEKEMLVYIDRKRVTDSVPKTEYIYRMNLGIQDTLSLGIPKDYVDKVIRPFIPKEGDYRDVHELARRQALAFEDER